MHLVNESMREKKKKYNPTGQLAHDFNPSTWEAEAGGFLSSRMVWWYRCLPCIPGNLSYIPGTHPHVDIKVEGATVQLSTALSSTVFL